MCSVEVVATLKNWGGFGSLKTSRNLFIFSRFSSSFEYRFFTVSYNDPPYFIGICCDIPLFISNFTILSFFLPSSQIG
jgi:hypothetical protein